MLTVWKWKDHSALLRDAMTWQDHDEIRRYHKEFHCIVYSGNECSPHSGTFIAPFFDIAIFKLQSAGFHDVLYAKLPQ